MAAAFERSRASRYAEFKQELQEDLGANFSNGESVQKFIGGLKSGNVSTADIPPICVSQKGGKIHSLDNRRLYAAQQAGVNIRFVRASPADLQRELRRKFTTENDGTSIVVRRK